MAYTRVWAQVLNLLGTRDSDEIDDGSREAHLDLEERFSDILFDVEADPWKVKVPGVAVDGSVTERHSAVPAITIGAAATRLLNVVHPTVAGTALNVLIPVTGWQGSKIRSFSVTGLRTHAGAVVTADLIQIVNGAASVLATISLTGVNGSFQTATSGVIDDIMIAGNAYYIQVNLEADVSGPLTAAVAQVGITYVLAGTF